MTATAWRHWVPWGGGLLLAALLGLTALDILRSREAAVQASGRELETQARIIAEQTARSVQAVDVVLRHLAQEYKEGRLPDLDSEAMHRHLREQAVGLVQIEGLLLADANGTVRSVSMGYPVAAASMNVAAFPAFQRMRHTALQGPVVGNVLKSPVDGVWAFPIARRLESADGRFAGVIAARGRVDYFQAFYRAVQLDQGTKATLMHREGTLLARHPPAEAALGQRFPLFNQMRDAAVRGAGRPLRSVSPLDGVDRFGALQDVSDYPLSVIVTRDVDVALGPWRAQAWRSGLRTLVLAAFGALLLVLVMRQLARLEAARRSLAEAQERFALAVAGSNQGLWDWDLAHDRLFVSPRAQELLGLAPGEPLRLRPEWLHVCEYHPDDLPRVRRALAAHLRGRTPHYESEYRMRHRDGSWHWYWQRGVALRNAQRRPYRLAGSMEDITDRKQAEARREQLETQLRQAQKLEAIGTLAGGIAHDFNNILAAILGYGEMAQKGAAQGTALRRHVDAVMSAGLRAKSLVERILAFSRSGVAERVPVHVQSVVSEALDLVSASLPHGVKLARELQCGDAAVLGDPTQIHQVVMNLCANAVQATKSGGTVTVRVDTERVLEPQVVATSTLPAGPYVRLAVHDTGSGIAPQIIERIFDPFFTTKEVGVGTGLGLSLVHGIVTDLGGGIAVRSEPGHGASFIVYLPCEQVMAPPVSEADAPIAGEGETILLVDDEEALVRLGEEMLAELGYEPVGFVSAAAALERFLADPLRFQAVVSDESMPGMTGTDLARAMRAVRPDLPVLLVSGYVSSALQARARDAGVLEVLSKPLAARDIARALAGALRVHCS